MFGAGVAGDGKAESNELDADERVILESMQSASAHAPDSERSHFTLELAVPHAFFGYCSSLYCISIFLLFYSHHQLKISSVFFLP